MRRTRESNGITLEVAEEETKIRRKYLEALEASNYADLPGEVYLKGFLRTYGNYLGLDGVALVEQYKDEQGGANAQRPGAAEVAAASPAADPAAPAPVPEAAINRAERQTRAAERRSSAGSPRLTGTGDSGRTVTTAIVVLAAVGIISYLGWLIAAQFDTGNKQVGPPPQSNAQAPPASKAPAPAPPAQLPEPQKVTMTRGTGEDVLFAVPAKEIAVKVELAPGERLWMEATVDGKKAFDGFPTQVIEFKGAQIRLRMGHMNGVSLLVNGQRFDKPLEKGPYTLVFNGQ